jgi:glycosyltransferase involved in cell wall biosynthesis
MRKEEKPDLAFVGYPPIETAWIMTKFLKKSSVPTILDVKDAWPDVLARGIPQPLRHLAKFLLLPYYSMMHATFRRSTFISSISPDYLSWSLKLANREKSEYDRVNYLSSMKMKFSNAEISNAKDYWDSQAIYDDGKWRVSYIGSLTNSLNFDRVLEAAGDLNVEFVIAGSGPAGKRFIEDSSRLSNVIFPGRVSAVQASVLAQRSTALLAPYDDLDDFQISLPNKFLDAMMHGRPILTSLFGFPENFIAINGIGRHYSNTKEGSLTTLIEQLSVNTSEVIQMGMNAQKLFDEIFSGEIVYSKLVDTLEEIIRNGYKSGTT